MRVPRLGNKACLSLGVLLAVVICASSFANASSYKQAFLTADQSGFAPNTDPNLINPWGISFSSTGPFWVSDNNSGLSTIYDGTGKPQSLVVTIPPVGGATSGTPTGTVFNGTTGFVVSKNGKSGPAAFLFDSEDGSISGWSPTVDATNAVVAVDNSGVSAVYKAMELAKNGGGVIVLKGLWALTFGNGGSGGSKDVLYFTSGPSNYAHGRFGSITFVP